MLGWKGVEGVDGEGGREKEKKKTRNKERMRRKGERKSALFNMILNRK